MVSDATVGVRLDLVNVSRHCADVYECSASNNVPPAVKRHIKLTVECLYTSFYYTYTFTSAAILTAQSPSPRLNSNIISSTKSTAAASPPCIARIKTDTPRP